MSAAPQTYKNHARFDPLFHYFIAIVLLINVIFTIVFLVRHHSPHHIAVINSWIVIMAVALLFLSVKVRSYSIKVQDRLIRLEETLRLKGLSVSQETISKLTIDQLCGLRFAADAELPGLAAQAVTEHLTRKQIKEKINNWRPDTHRV